MCFERRINVLYHEIPTIFDISFNILFVPGLNGISRETPGCQNREFPVLPGFSYRDLMRFPGRSRFLTPGLTGSFTREVPGWNSRFWLKFAGTGTGTGSPKNACPGTGTGRNRESRSGTNQNGAGIFRLGTVRLKTVRLKRHTVYMTLGGR